MARRHGRNGRLYVGIASATAAAEPLVNMKKWSSNFTTDRVDCTAFGDTNKVYVAGLADASGDFDGYWDDVSLQTYTAAIDGIARRTYFYPDVTNVPGTYWYGTCFLDFTIDVPVDGVIAAKVTWSPATPIVHVP